MKSSEGWTLSSTFLPMNPNATTTTAQHTSTGTAWRTAKRATGVIKTPFDPNPKVPQAGYDRRERTRAALTLPHATVFALLDELELFEALEDDEIDSLAREVKTVRWEPGTVVFEEGDHGEECYVIHTGSVKVTRRLVDGQPIALAQVGHGGVVGELALFASERRAGTLQAVDLTTAVTITREQLMGILRGNAEAAISMAIHVARLLQRATDRQFAAATSTVNGRILATLLAQVEARQAHSPGQENIELVGSTSDLARSAGTQKDDAARVLHWLENEGVLRVKRGRIIVRSTPALRGYLD
jgi:CRP/FNR family transcriptional regulator, cyclic AMP receptor protein